MDDTEKIVTIVGSVLAHEGSEFVYAGKIPECDNCKVGKVCHNAKIIAKSGKSAITQNSVKDADIV